MYSPNSRYSHKVKRESTAEMTVPVMISHRLILMSNKLKFQWAKAAAMFSNYQEIIKNWGLAVNSMGFTDNQVKNQMDSLSRRINKLKADLNGIVAQSGNSGLSQVLKNLVSDLDRFVRFLSSLDVSTYKFIGNLAEMLLMITAVNKALRLLRSSGVAAGILEMATAFKGAKTAAEGLAAAIGVLRKSISLLKGVATFGVALLADWGIDKIQEAIEGDADAINKETDATIENVAVKRQQIEMYTQQEDYLDALFTAHQKLTAEIESSTTSDEKKKKLLEDRIETENQMANVVGWSAVQQMQADNWTDESTKKVRDDYRKATDDKKKALAQFIAAKRDEAIANYETAIKNMENWKQETHEFCLGMSDRIKSIKDYTDSVAIAYAILAKFDEIRSSALDDRIKDLENSKKRLSELAADPNHTWTEGNSKYYNDLSDQIEEAKVEKAKISKSVYNAKFQAEYYENGKSIMTNYEAAKREYENLGDSTLTNPGGPIDTSDLLGRWGYGEGAGGDVYNPSPSSSHSKSSHTRKKKDPNYVKEDWQYGDPASQMMSELAKKFEATFGTKNGLDIATLTAIASKLTGIKNLDFSSVPDLFGAGGRNTWESGRLFYQKLAPYLANGLDLAQALSHITPNISEEDWRSTLNNNALYLRNKYNYNKNDRKFSDPNEQPGGYYDLGGSSGGSVDVGDEDYAGNDEDEGHLWELAVIAASKAKTVKDPRWYWLIMMHESGRGKDPTAKKNHNFAGMGGGAGVDMGSDDHFTTELAETLDNMFPSAPNNIGELAYGMYTHGYYTGDAVAYQSDLEALNNENLIQGGSSGNKTQTSDVNGIYSGGYDVDDKSMYGLDSRYMTMSGSWDNIENLQPYVRRLLNIIANRYYAATGMKLAINSLTGGQHAESQWGHRAGYKADLSIDNNQEVLASILKDYGVSAAVESGTHYDVSFGQGGDGRSVDSASYGIVGDGTGSEAWERYHNGPMKGNANSIRKPSFWNGHKSSLADFTRNEIEETIYDQDKQQKLYEARKKNIEYDMKIQGNTYELLRANDVNEQAYYDAVEKNRKGWADKYDELTDNINDFLNEHVEIKNKLDGKSIFEMPQDELRKLAELSKDDEFKKFIDNLFKVREQLSNANSKLVELRVAKKIRDGYMTPEQDEDYRLNRLNEWYNRSTSNKTDGEKYMDTHELYQSQIAIYKERLKRQNKGLMDARRRDQEQLEEYYEQLDDIQNGKHNEKGELVEKGLAQYKGDNSEDAKAKTAELKKKLKDLQENIDQLSKHGSENFQKMQKDVEDTEAKIREIAEKDDEVTKNLWDTIENDVGDMFFDIIKQGSSFKESWKKLWDDVAKIALQQILRMTVNRWLFNARTTIDDAISNRNAGKNAAINVGAGLINGASKYTSPKKWTQVATGNRYLDMANGVTNGNYFPMKSNGANTATSINKSLVKETSKLSSVTQKAATLTNVSNTLTQTATAKDALNTSATTTQTAVTQAQIAATQANTEAMIMAGTKPSISLGGHAMGGLLTTAYANGGMISGAGTGKSDSILAYLADKDRFVFLSNGEYVMTAEATSRIGKDNLDAMNYGGFADGGALNPTPYVPQISPRVAKRAEMTRVTNPNARMEQLMQEQTDTIKNMGNSDGSGNVVVLNTHASSDDVMNAIHRNPRAFQTILHNQKRHGFR